MCEMFGVSAREPAAVNDLLREFFSHSERHGNGWGMAVFRGGLVSVEKEPVQAIHSDYLRERLRNRIEERSMIAHIRLATVGSTEYDNCHPFVGWDNSGRCWTLAHNGTIFHYPAHEPYRAVQKGQTDSERILHYLMDCIDRRQQALGRALTAPERCALLDEQVADMARGNKLNLLIWDGELLYAHTNYASSLYSRRQGDAVFLATTPLGGEDWAELPFTALCAYRDGERVYEGAPHGHEYRRRSEDKDVQPLGH